MPFKLLVLLITCCFVWKAEASLLAGSAAVDGTLPVGVPLAGYNHGARRVPYYPIPSPTPYTTWMTPSVGVMDPTWVKALYLEDDNHNAVMLVTMDAIGSDGPLVDLAHTYAVTLGLPLEREQVIFGASHTHSGPGGVSPSFLWQVAPAVDLLVNELQEAMARSLAKAMVTAYQTRQLARMNTSITQLVGVTQNRRARISPFVQPGTIDPNLGVVRVDSVNGSPIATLWNFAVHGVCYGPENLYASGDIMGKANQLIELELGGVALFMNGDAGDVDPTSKSCENRPSFFGAHVMKDAVLNARANMSVTDNVSLKIHTITVPFGLTHLNATLRRFANCTSGGPLDICSLCAVLNCDLDLRLGSAWLENQPRFSALRLKIDSSNTVMVTMPGEPLVELGWWVRNDTLKLGFDKTFLLGYSQNHLGYFATGNEYDIGGYESQLTMFGYYTANKVREGCYNAAIGVL